METWLHLSLNQLSDKVFNKTYSDIIWVANSFDYFIPSERTKYSETQSLGLSTQQAGVLAVREE